MPRLSLLLVLLALVACDSSDDRPSIDGTWTATRTSTVTPDGQPPAQQTETVLYTFDTDGDDVSGTFEVRVEGGPDGPQTIGPGSFTGTYAFPDLTLTFPGGAGVPAQTTHAEVNAGGTEIVVFTEAIGGGGLIPLYTLHRR